jgi:hypothetical protein
MVVCFSCLGAVANDVLSNRRGSGECNLIDQRMLDERVPERAAGTGDQIVHAFG